MLNRTSPRIKPWGTLLVSMHLIYCSPIYYNLRALPLSQFITQSGTNVFISQLDNLFRILRGKALLKYRKIMCTTFSSSLPSPRLFPYLLYSPWKEGHNIWATSGFILSHNNDVLSLSLSFFPHIFKILNCFLTDTKHWVHVCTEIWVITLRFHSRVMMGAQSPSFYMQS